MIGETYIRKGIAIVSPYGGIWTSEIFNTPEEAQRYLVNYWKNIQGHDISRYRLVAATQTVTMDRGLGELTFIDMPAS